MIFQHLLLDEILDTLIDENPLKLDLTRTKDAYVHEAAMIYSYVYTYTPSPPEPVSEQAIANLAYAMRLAFETMHGVIIETDRIIGLSRALMANTRETEKNLFETVRTVSRTGAEEKSIGEVFNELLDRSEEEHARMDDLPAFSDKDDPKWKLN